MAQDQIQYQHACSCTELALFESNLGESGNYTGFLCGLFAKRYFPPYKKGLAQNRPCNFLKTRFTTGPIAFAYIRNKKHRCFLLTGPPCMFFTCPSYPCDVRAISLRVNFQLATRVINGHNRSPPRSPSSPLNSPQPTRAPFPSRRRVSLMTAGVAAGNGVMRLVVGSLS